MSGLKKDAAYWAHVRAVVDKAPPLSSEQKLRLKALVGKEVRHA